MSKKNQHIVYVQTRYGRYQCTLEPDRRGFIATVSGLPEVITWGKNITHAKEMVKEAIELCVECRVEGLMPKVKTRPRTTTRESLMV